MAGKLVPSSLLSTTVEFTSTGPVITDGYTTENDHSIFMEVDGQQMWIKKADAATYNGSHVTLPMPFVVDNKMEVEGVTPEEVVPEPEPEPEPEPTAEPKVKPSLGAETTFPSGKKEKK